MNPETKDFIKEARIWNKYEFVLLYRFSGKREGYAWGFAPNPARELSSLDPSLRYRCAIAERGNSYLAAQKEILQCACALLAKRLKTAAKRRKGAGNEVPCRGLGQCPNRNPPPELYTPLWITSPVVLGISKSFQQPKSLLTARFLGLIQVVNRPTTPSAEHIYCYYPMEV